MNQELADTLRRHSLRVTRPRQVVFDTLTRSSQPLFLKELNSLCSEIDRVSIYRTLELFIQLGVVSVVPIGWKKRYELASPFKPHHHHIQCIHCHRLESINDSALERQVEAISLMKGYVLIGHSIELQGICQHCQHLVK